MVKFLPLLLVLWFSGTLVLSQTYADSPADFFFSKEVGEQPMLMSPGFISSGMGEAYGALGPDGDEFYYCITEKGVFSAILATRFHDGFWTYPEVVSFSGEYMDASPFVTPDGRFLFFTSNRPSYESDLVLDWNVWRSSRMQNGDWSTPELMSFSNGDRNEVSVSVDRQGIVYFSADYDGGTITLDENALDIFSVQSDNQENWIEAVKLSPAVNSEFPERDPAISPDGKCLVFSSPRPEGEGTSDLYVSYKSGEDWGEAVSLGTKVNSTAYECCPMFTSDGRIFIFSSTVTRKMPRQLRYSSIKKWLLGPGNGSGDIWYMDASVILRD
ncbi:TolB family protein [Marinilabilia salmonicolor]|uniref:TolB family protein n=1 Tax=Marinilabilia salmonicolor TaxID=989 RepID=UPI0002F899EB|nr:PD40 domain-containing protein [Marinilabilia salmonicolor]